MDYLEIVEASDNVRGFYYYSLIELHRDKGSHLINLKSTKSWFRWLQILHRVSPGR